MSDQTQAEICLVVAALGLAFGAYNLGTIHGEQQGHQQYFIGAVECTKLPDARIECFKKDQVKP